MRAWVLSMRKPKTKSEKPSKNFDSIIRVATTPAFIPIVSVR